MCTSVVCVCGGLLDSCCSARQPRRHSLRARIHNTRTHFALHVASSACKSVRQHRDVSTAIRQRQRVRVHTCGERHGRSGVGTSACLSCPSFQHLASGRTRWSTRQQQQCSSNAAATALARTALGEASAVAAAAAMASAAGASASTMVQHPGVALPYLTTAFTAAVKAAAQVCGAHCSSAGVAASTASAALHMMW